MFIFDVFIGQTTKNVLDLIAENDCVYLFVTNNLTNEFQLLDLIINDHVKQFLNKKFEEWYAMQVTQRLKDGEDLYFH